MKKAHLTFCVRRAKSVSLKLTYTVMTTVLVINKGLYQTKKKNAKQSEVKKINLGSLGQMVENRAYWEFSETVLH